MISWKYFLICWLGLILQTADGQVVFREYLSQNHQGQISESENYPGQPLGYEWKFIDMEKGQYFAEGEAIQKIRYQLHFQLDGKAIGHFDLQIRDLIVTHYIEISVVKADTARTITALYNKSSRWLRLKGVLQEGCRREGVSWGRLDGVESYDQLLQFVVQQIDKNIYFSCFFE